MSQNLKYVFEVFEADVKEGTARQYLWHVKQYLDWLGQSPESVNPNKAIQEYIRDKTLDSEKPWSKRMVNVAFYALKKYYEKILGMPVEKRFFTNLGRETEHQPRILSREEESLILERANELDTTEAVMIHIGWYCALRSGELVHLEKKWFDPETRTLRIRIEKAENAWKAIVLPQTLAERLMNLERTGRKYFFNKYDEKQDRWRKWTPYEWSSYFRKWNSGILEDEGVRWHDFARHTRLTHFAEDRKNFFAVLQLSGHQNPAVCRKYFQWAKVKVPELEVIEEPKWEWTK